MNNSSLLLLSFTVGILVVIQGGINARLGILLNNTLLATSAALVMSASFTLIAVFMTVRELPNIDQLQSIPTYMIFYYIIPRIGISTAVIFGLSGQIIFAAIAGHFGWFGMPLEPMTIKKVMGMIVMTLGILLIKY